MIKDTFGHAAADGALCAIASALRSRLRAYDVPSRFGSDEIVVLFADTTLVDANHVADQLHTGIGALEIHHEGKVLPRISSTSMGVSAYPSH